MPFAPAVDSWITRLVALDGAVDGANPARIELVRRAQAGDSRAFEALVRAAGPRLLGIARKILRDPDAADDALQQAVIMAWRMLPRLRDPDRFEGWIYKLLVSACYAEANTQRRFAAQIRRVDAEPATADATDQSADRAAIEHAFRRLTPAHRAVVVLHHYADLPLTEVASILGISPGTARSRLHYALRALRAGLEAADRPSLEELPR